jgi:hypothetical protein
VFKWLLGAIGLVAALGGLVMLIGRHDAAVRQSGRDEINLKWEGEREARAEALAEFEQSLDGKLRQRFEVFSAQLGTIDREGQAIQIKLPQAIAADPRYRDPNCALTPAVRDQINSARALSSAP